MKTSLKGRVNKATNGLGLRGLSKMLAIKYWLAHSGENMIVAEHVTESAWNWLDVSQRYKLKW